MKRISALLIALLMICLLLPTTAMAAEEKPFWVTHFNDASSEGAGTIFTTDYSGAGWWLHFAFAPTDVEGVYEIVDTTNGLADGSAIALAIPEGGFVWAANVGNNYQQINNNPDDIDYTSDNCSNCINDVQLNWMEGTLVQFNGLDLEGMTIPTTTPDVAWYDDAYVCTATYSIYEGDASSDNSSEEPTDTSSDESVEVSDEESVEVSTEESKTESVAATSSEAPVDEEDGGLGTGAIVAIVVAVVAVIVVIVIVVAKKKK